tara:strand:+ start:1497 stop:2084 length:588 start_codon:yes stop_codon:yes gene_type:complete
MKSLRKFIVNIPKKFNDTVKLGDEEIYIETKFNEFEHRVMEGEVIALPAKYETPVKEGDTLYFHHHVVLQGGTPLPGMEDYYMVLYSPDSAIDSQAFAYKCKDTGKIGALSSWCLLEPVEEDFGLKSDIIEIVKTEKENPTQGKVTHTCSSCEDLGVEVGDTVGIGKNRDYLIKIDGKEYYRTRAEDFLYVITEE